MTDEVRKEIEQCCYEIAQNVRKYEHGDYDYEHYVAIFEGNRNQIYNLFESKDGVK